jgi:hypothetical protein
VGSAWRADDDVRIRSSGLRLSVRADCRVFRGRADRCPMSQVDMAAEIATSVVADPA